MKHDHIIITGDLNLKQIDWVNGTVKGNTARYQYQIFDCINDLFLNEMVKEPTRFRCSITPSTLDWVLTENPNCIQDIVVDSPL